MNPKPIEWRCGLCASCTQPKRALARCDLHNRETDQDAPVCQQFKPAYMTMKLKVVRRGKAA